MGLKHIISDFDGTLTDSEASLGGFFPLYHQMFAKKVGVDQEAYLRSLEIIQDELEEDTFSGWSINGYIVAPINSDPFALNTASHMALLKSMREGRFPSLRPTNLPKSDSKANELTNECHLKSYKEKMIIFRDGARPFVVNMNARYETFSVVTNSGTDDVKEALNQNSFSDVRVVGMAKKYIPTPDFNFVPMYTELHGFPRPVLLRRGLYHAVLFDIVDNPSEAGIFGDNFELDLALPMHLGFTGVLLDTPAAQPHEIAYMMTHPNGFFARDYKEAEDFFNSRT